MAAASSSFFLITSDHKPITLAPSVTTEAKIRAILVNPLMSNVEKALEVIRSVADTFLLPSGKNFVRAWFESGCESPTQDIIKQTGRDFILKVDCGTIVVEYASASSIPTYLPGLSRTIITSDHGPIFLDVSEETKIAINEILSSDRTGIEKAIAVVKLVANTHLLSDGRKLLKVRFEHGADSHPGDPIKQIDGHFVLKVNSGTLILESATYPSIKEFAKLLSTKKHIDFEKGTKILIPVSRSEYTSFMTGSSPLDAIANHFPPDFVLNVYGIKENENAWTFQFDRTCVEIFFHKKLRFCMKNENSTILPGALT